MTTRFLEGRVAWVTGGASGMGRAMALALAAVGADGALFCSSFPCAFSACIFHSSFLFVFSVCRCRSAFPFDFSVRQQLSSLMGTVGFSEA